MNQKLISPVAFLIAVIMSTALMAEEPELASGGWVKKSYDIDGSWKIVERDGQKIIVFDEDFRTKKGPDLKVYLSKLPIETLRDSQVEGSSVKISPLKSNKGVQEYAIPTDIELDEFSSVLVHCEKYSHLWGGGDLE